MLILGIETSCDDTGIAIYDTNNGLIGHSLTSQVATHQQYGGIVPELASRDHVNNLVPLLDHLLSINSVSIEKINRIAYTKGPGLIGSLLTGACFAKSLAYSLNIPAIGIHHLEAHILVAIMENPQLKFPFLVMLVSGGHTMLVHAKSLGNYEILSQTVDDAIGEAFDKTAKLMEILYPGGPALANIADQCPDDLKTILPPFPKPLCDRSNLNFSFSGLKTHALNIWNKNDSLSQDCLRSAIAYRFQEATIATLIHKIKIALKKTNLTNLVLAGGVAANQYLRNELQKLENLSSITLPAKEFCTDNGAMIAYAAALYNENCFLDDSLAICPLARWARFL